MTTEGVVLLLTGRSGAGKSTIACLLAETLREAGPRSVSVLDGDELRRTLSADLGFDASSRTVQLERAARMASERAGRGEIVILALIAPFEHARAGARAIIERTAPFILVHVKTPLEVAEARDVKGLYARARRGELPDFTGISSPYEEPEAADVVIDTTQTSLPEAVAVLRQAIDDALAEGARRARI
jgi:sulfate adenylyltransferase